MYTIFENKDTMRLSMISNVAQDIEHKDIVCLCGGFPKIPMKLNT